MAWTKEDKTRSMVVLAQHAGNSASAAAALKEQFGLGIEARTLRKWRTSECREEYDRILADMPDMTQSVINETLETARLAAQAERLAVQRTMAELEAGTCKDPARAARDLSHIKATNVEKFLLLNKQPTQIVEHQTPDQMLAALVRDKIFLPVGDGDDDAMTIDLPDEMVRELTASNGSDADISDVGS